MNLYLNSSPTQTIKSGFCKIAKASSIKAVDSIYKPDKTVLVVRVYFRAL